MRRWILPGEERNWALHCKHTHTDTHIRTHTCFPCSSTRNQHNSAGNLYMCLFWEMVHAVLDSNSASGSTLQLKDVDTGEHLCRLKNKTSPPPFLGRIPITLIIHEMNAMCYTSPTRKHKEASEICGCARPHYSAASCIIKQKQPYLLSAALFSYDINLVANQGS